MRHRVKNIRINHRDAPHAKAIVRNLVTSFFLHTALVTTEKKARILASQVDHIMQIAQSDMQEMNKIRSLNTIMFTPEASRAALRIAQDMKSHTSGFTRITPIQYRVGDSAKLVKIEFAL